MRRPWGGDQSGSNLENETAWGQDQAVVAGEGDPGVPFIAPGIEAEVFDEE